MLHADRKNFEPKKIRLDSRFQANDPKELDEAVERVDRGEYTNLEYNAYVDRFNSDDYFVSGEVTDYPTALLKTMFQKGIIANVFRDYEDSGFGRIK